MKTVLKRSMPGLVAVTMVLAIALFVPSLEARGADRGKTAVAPEACATNAVPDANVLLQGRAFETKFDRDVYFLRKVREGYPAYWPVLLGANILAQDYVRDPAKLQRFVEELGAAMADTDDLIASTNLAAITADPAFYANTNAYHPEILRSAALALLKIGPNGRQALAASFSEAHYRTDSESLQELAEVIGTAPVSDPLLAQALAATAFTLTAGNGGTYPQCTETAARNLLRLADGPRLALEHLNSREVFANPGRFQAVMDGIAAARAAGLTGPLAALDKEVTARLAELAGSPGGYRDDLVELSVRLKRTVAQLRGSG